MSQSRELKVFVPVRNNIVTVDSKKQRVIEMRGMCRQLHAVTVATYISGGICMNAIKLAQHFISKNPGHKDARALAQLVLSLEAEIAFPLTLLYQMDLDRFNVALDILKEWRLDRYYAGKAKLFDMAVQLQNLTQSEGAEPIEE